MLNLWIAWCQHTLIRPKLSLTLDSLSHWGFVYEFLSCGLLGSPMLSNQTTTGGNDLAAEGGSLERQHSWLTCQFSTHSGKTSKNVNANAALVSSPPQWDEPPPPPPPSLGVLIWMLNNDVGEWIKARQCEKSVCMLIMKVIRLKWYSSVCVHISPDCLNTHWQAISSFSVPCPLVSSSAAPLMTAASWF